MSINQSGLTFLIQQAKRRGLKIYQQERSVPIPVYSFINQIISSIKNYLKSTQYHLWYIYFLQKTYDQKALITLIKSWQKLKQTSLECQLLQNFLLLQNKNKIKLYLKARKLILQARANVDMIDDILLTLEDTISVIYKLFSNQSVRKAAMTGIKNIFVAFQISEAKIYSSVFIEYLLSIYDTIFHLETKQATLTQQFQTYNSGIMNNKSYLNHQSNNNSIPFSYNSIQNFQSSIHQDNGLYKKLTYIQSVQKKYQIIDRKFLNKKNSIEQIEQNIKLNDKKTFHFLNKSIESNNFLSNKSEKEQFFKEFIKKVNKQQERKIQQKEKNFQKAQQNIHYDIKSYQYSKSKSKGKAKQLRSNFYQSIQMNKQILQKNKLTSKRLNQHQKSPFINMKNSMFSPKNTKLSLQKPKYWRKQFSLQKFNKQKNQSFPKQNQVDSLAKRNTSKTRIPQKYDSTQIFEIENQILKKNQDKKKIKEKSQQKSHNQYLIESKLIKQKSQSNNNNTFVSKSYDSLLNMNNQNTKIFEQMISKNKQFKQKMLSKNCPSNRFSTMNINNECFDKNGQNKIGINNNIGNSNYVNYSLKQIDPQNSIQQSINCLKQMNQNLILNNSSFYNNSINNYKQNNQLYFSKIQQLNPHSQIHQQNPSFNLQSLSFRNDNQNSNEKKKINSNNSSHTKNKTFLILLKNKQLINQKRKKLENQQNSAYEHIQQQSSVHKNTGYMSKFSNLFNFDNEIQ